MISVDTYHLLGPFNINLGDFASVSGFFKIIFSSMFLMMSLFVVSLYLWAFCTFASVCICVFVFIIYLHHHLKSFLLTLCDQSPSLCLSLLWLDESWVPVRQVAHLSQERFSFHFSSQLFSITTSHFVVITRRVHLCGLCFASLWAHVEFFFVTLG